MTHTNSTDRFDLPLWDGTDDFTRTEFNDAHQSIEDKAAMFIVDPAGTGSYAAASYPQTFLQNSTSDILYYSDGTTWTVVAGEALSIDTADLVNLAVSTAKIANLAVTDAKLASSAVSTAKIAELAVTSSKIGANAVIAGKINTSAVTEGTIATGAVTATKIADYSIESQKLISGQVIDTIHLLGGAVTESKLANGSVTEGKINDGAVTVTKIGTSAVTKAKLGSDVAKGIVGITFLPVGSQSPITAETDIQIGATALAATFTAVAGKTYRVTAYLNVATVGSTSADLRIKVGSTVYGRSVNYVRPWSSPNTFATTIRCETLITELSAGSTTIKASLQTTDAMTSVAPTVTTLVDRSFILVEDMGLT